MVPASVERSQLPGHRQRSQIPQHRQWALRRPFSPTFPAGDRLVFIPWRVVAAKSGAAPSASAARCCSTGAGRGVRFSGIVGRGYGATMELGRSSCWQLRGRPALPAGDRQALGGVPLRARAAASRPRACGVTFGPPRARTILRVIAWCGAMPRIGSTIICDRRCGCRRS